MKKTIVTIALVATSLFTGALAQAKPRTLDRFVHKQSGYNVIVMEAPHNGRVLEGVNQLTGQTFMLSITARGHVSGTFEGRNIDYMIDENGKQILTRDQLAEK